MKHLIVLLVVAGSLLFAAPAMAWSDGWSVSDSFQYHTADGWFTCYVQVERYHMPAGSQFWDQVNIRAKTNNTGHNKTFHFQAYTNWDFWGNPLTGENDLLVGTSWTYLGKAQTKEYVAYKAFNQPLQLGLVIGFVGVQWTDQDGYHDIGDVRHTLGDNTWS